MSSGNFYFYKLTTDNGGAPCCTSDLWSLAICKPRVRSGAAIGDYVVGFAGNSIDPENGIVHVARVTDKLRSGAYYERGSQYRSRADCIYERVGSDYRLRRNPFHAESDMDRDLGLRPLRAHADVLLSTDFRYFGERRFQVDWGLYPHLRARLNALQQGERVNHVPEVLMELRNLVQEAYGHPGSKVLGSPTHKTPSPCNRDDDQEECRC